MNARGGPVAPEWRMCVVAFAWSAHPRWRFVLAGNRDEFHGRPTAPLARWPDAGLLAGRDLQSGGTWVGIGPAGKVAVVTNVRDGLPPPHAGPSRGALPVRFLAGDGKAISAQAKAGMELFNGKGRCMTCHPMNPSNPLGTDNRFHNVGVSARHQDFEGLASKALKALREDASEQKLDELKEGHGGEGGPLEEVVDEKGRVSKKAVAARLKDLGRDADAADDERGERGSELAGLADRDDLPERFFCAVLLHEEAELNRHDHTDEDRCRARDGEAAHAELLDLVDEGPRLEARGEEHAEEAPREGRDLADLLERAAETEAFGDSAHRVSKLWSTTS